MTFPKDPNQPPLTAVSQRIRNVRAAARRNDLVSAEGASELREIWLRSPGDVPEWPS